MKLKTWNMKVVALSTEKERLYTGNQSSQETSTIGSKVGADEEAEQEVRYGMVIVVDCWYNGGIETS